MSFLNLNKVFSEVFPSERRTIVEPLLARYEHYGITMNIDGPTGIVLTIGAQHWSLSTGSLFSATVSKKSGFFCKISAVITAFRRKIAAVNLISQENFYDNGAPAVLRRLAAVSVNLPAVSAELPAIFE